MRLPNFLNFESSNEAKEWWKIYLGIALAVFGMVMVGYALITSPDKSIPASVVTLFGTILAWIGAIFGIDANTKIKIHEQEVSSETRSKELDYKMRKLKFEEKRGKILND